MAKIIPYRPFFYGAKYQSQLGDLISPPYDVISNDAHRSLLKRHELNSIRLSLAENAEDPNRYEKMKSLFLEWKEKKVFETTPSPCFCLIEEKFQMGGSTHKRIGFVGLLEATSFDQKQVLPHEHTLSGPKADRLELLKKMGAELSQVFLCYNDTTLTLENLYRRYFNATPTEHAIDAQKIERRMWTITDSKEIEALQKLIASKSLLIADGHHRYETSVYFRTWDGTAKSQYVQAYFTNLDSPGFSILPIHRIFALPDEISPSSFERKLEQTYEIEAWEGPLSVEALNKNRDASTLAFFCALRDPDRIILLKRRVSGPNDAEIFSIHKNIFEAILGWDVTKLAKGTIHYEHETEDFKKTLLKIDRGVGLFLPPTDIRLVMKLAEQGERMPQKSTFFYPKLASGFVNYELGSY